MPSEQQNEMKPVLRALHSWWFGPLDGPLAQNPEKSEMWFKQSDETDDYCRKTFGAYVPVAAKIDWDLGDLTREEQVGLVVLLDQMPRNIHRESGEAFAYDAKAREIANKMLENGLGAFYLVEQSFVCLPLEHSEDVADQDRAVLLFAEMAVTAPEGLEEIKRYGLDFATKHRDLIRKFGRFPHRNAVLGRESTEEEEAFLAEHGRGF